MGLTVLKISVITQLNLIEKLSKQVKNFAPWAIKINCENDSFGTVKKRP